MAENNTNEEFISDYDPKKYQPGFLTSQSKRTVKNESPRVNKYDTYVSRNVTEDTLDWSTVAQEITGQLNAVAADRFARRKDIEDRTKDAVSILEDIDDYTNPNVNDAVIDMAQGIKEQLLIRNKLLKSGGITPVDYLKFVEAAKSQMKTWSTASKNFEEDYLAHKERQALNEDGVSISGADETFSAESYYGFGNMENVKSFVSPTGKAYLVKVDPETGDMPDFNKEPGKFLPVQNMNGRNKFTSDGTLFDVNYQVKLQTKNVGNFLNAKVSQSIIFKDGMAVLTEKGKAALETNPEMKKMYEDYKTTVKNRIISGDQALANILVGTIGNDYHYATSEKEFIEKYGEDTSKMILLDMTTMPPTYIFGENNENRAAMQKVAEDMVDNQIDMQIGSTSQEDEKTKPLTDDQRDGSGPLKEDLAINFEIAYEVATRGAKGKKAVDQIVANNDSIANIYTDPLNDQTVIQFTDGRNKRIPNAKNSEGEYDPRGTAVSIMAAVNPDFDVSQARQAERDFRGTIPLSAEDLSSRKAQSPYTVGNGSTNLINDSGEYDTVTAALKKIKGSDGAKRADEYQNLLQSLYVEDNTDYITRSIKVAGLYTGAINTRDELKITIPPEVYKVLRDDGILNDENIIKSHGGDGDMNFVDIVMNQQSDRVKLNTIINAIFKATNNAYATGEAPNTEGEDNQEPPKEGKRKGY